MKAIKIYRNFARTLATAMIIGQGFYYVSTNPGPMDTYNGAMAGIVLYCIWFGRGKDE